MLVYVCYATPQQQIEIPLKVENSCTVALAIKRSGILERFPELNMANLVVGIYSRKVPLDNLLQEQDRIEIYRPLQQDPKEARRRRAGSK